MAQKQNPQTGKWYDDQNLSDPNNPNGTGTPTQGQQPSGDATKSPWLSMDPRTNPTTSGVVSTVGQNPFLVSPELGYSSAAYNNMYDTWAGNTNNSGKDPKADWTRQKLQLQIEDQMNAAKNDPAKLQALRDKWSNPTEIHDWLVHLGVDESRMPTIAADVNQLAEHTKNLYAQGSAKTYFPGGPEVQTPDQLGPASGQQYADATRAAGTPSAWGMMQSQQLGQDVAKQQANLPGQIQNQGTQAIQQGEMRGGMSSRKIDRVPILGQKQAMLGRQQIGQSGALGQQAIKQQDEQQRMSALQGATGQEQSMMNTQLQKWAGQKIGEAY
jgi:hypothetical protein